MEDSLLTYEYSICLRRSITHSVYIHSFSKNSNTSHFIKRLTYTFSEKCHTYRVCTTAVSAYATLKQSPDWLRFSILSQLLIRVAITVMSLCNEIFQPALVLHEQADGHEIDLIIARNINTKFNIFTLRMTYLLHVQLGYEDNIYTLYNKHRTPSPRG